ncbi:MAG TPA: hypothetical protein VFX59_03640, partial [Polyangiales bacterium]|nr:hypothetical protein [Polyangiales bacterium]
MAWMLVSRAHAQSEPIALDTRACASVDGAELRRILALERRVEDTPGSLQVDLRCDSDRAWLRAEGTTRELELASVPEGLRARLLALAIAELRPTLPELRRTPAPKPAQRFRLSLAALGQLSSLAAGGAQLQLSTRVRP